MIHVATPDECCEAYRALRAEGVEAEEHLLTRDTDYGSLVYRLWNLGQPFVLIEWDIVPVPGTILPLLECDKPWCVHEYHLQPLHLAHSMGVGKYRPVGRAPEVWKEAPWWLLDAYVVECAVKRLGKPPHIHTPPFAHCRRLDRDPDLSGIIRGT